MEDDGAADIDKKIQAVRVLLLSLSERFHQTEMEYKTYKLYAHDADTSSARLAVSAHMKLNIAQAQQVLSVTKLKECLAARENNMMIGRGTWTLLQSLMSSVAELSVSYHLVLNKYFCQQCNQ